jgi:peptidoglycan hydrolase CwlO-like protein
MKVMACVLCATLFAAMAPPAATASSASIARSIRQKKARAAELEKQLAATRPDLMKALADVDEVDAQLQDIRSQMQDTDATLAMMNGEISAGEATLNDRAVTLYKSGGYDVIEALLSVRSLEDLLSRIDMISYIQTSDDELLRSLASSRNQVSFLQSQQEQREAQLITLRQEADARKAVVESLIAQQEALLNSVGTDIEKLVQEEATARAAEAAAGGTYEGTTNPPVGFNPNTLVSNETYGDATALSVDGIQGFLNGQPGVLKSYSARDHNGVVRSAAEMIAQAAQAWGVNPKVILVTLQKEQSLLTDGSPTQRALDWAMGCGKMDGSTLNQYQGFGNQIWGGARALARNRSYWRAGISLSIDGNAVYPSNSATHSLYRYTPHLHGNVLFWRIYWRYFGNPAA